MGEIVAVDGDGFLVACADGRIKVLRVKPADGPKTAAGEFATAASHIAEADSLVEVTGTRLVRAPAVILAALRGKEAEASALIQAELTNASTAGSGRWVKRTASLFRRGATFCRPRACACGCRSIGR